MHFFCLFLLARKISIDDARYDARSKNKVLLKVLLNTFVSSCKKEFSSLLINKFTDDANCYLATAKAGAAPPS